MQYPDIMRELALMNDPVKGSSLLNIVIFLEFSNFLEKRKYTALFGIALSFLLSCLLLFHLNWPVAS
uniref:Uncharacterized protein n=1 Tax=Glycine max TaxID=3847 RepID=K7M926_SOYBN